MGKNRLATSLIVNVYAIVKINNNFSAIQWTVYKIGFCSLSSRYTLEVEPDSID